MGFEFDFGYFKVKNVNMIWVTRLITPSNGRVFSDRFLFSFPKLGVFDTSHKEFFQRKKLLKNKVSFCVNLLRFMLGRSMVPRCSDLERKLSRFVLHQNVLVRNHVLVALLVTKKGFFQWLC